MKNEAKPHLEPGGRRGREFVIWRIIMIVFDHVSKTYETGTSALNDVSFKINNGEFVFIVGNSGSGKSTIIKLLTRELDATGGRVVVNNKILGKLRRKNIAKYRRGIGIIFQDFRLLNDRNVYENVAFAQRVTGTSLGRMRKQVPAMLSVVGLAEKYKANPKQLSGGEQQRVAIARALVNNPSILLADEPTGNLDPKNTREIMSLLDEINRRGTTVIVVTHNREVVDSMKKRVITMHKGSVVADERRGGYK